MNGWIETHLDRERIAEFCRRWRIAEMALFGSVLREDFRPDSDVDVLVTFEPAERWSLLDFTRAKLELSDLLEREADMVEARNLVNPFRRNEILSTKQVIHAA